MIKYLEQIVKKKKKCKRLMFVYTTIIIIYDIFIKM
jgi:hypothetical protein